MQSEGIKILYFPQLSMYDKQTGKFTPQADGNINMMRNFINAWHKYRPNDLFGIVLPSELEGEGLEAIFNNGKTGVYPILYDNYVVSSRINRFNFPMSELADIIKEIDIKYDLVINDVTELARNIKMMFKYNIGYEPKIVSNLHHVDEEINMDYIFSVIDGIDASDYATILSQSMKDMLYDHFHDVLYYHYANDLINKIEVFEPSVSADEIDNYTSLIIEESVKIITFPGRLSKGEEGRTNWDKFIAAIISLREKREDFIVYLTDPNNSMTDELKNSSKEWIRTIEKDRGLFLTLLNNTDIVVSLMDIQGFGGISIREALMAGCMPIIPYKHEYINMAPKGYEGFVHGEITAEKLAEKIDWALDQNTSYDVKAYGYKYSVENQMKDLISKLEVILNG